MRLFAPAPARRLALARVLVGGYACIDLLARIPLFLSFRHFDPASFAPVGAARLLAEPLPTAWLAPAALLGPLAALGFALGWRFRVTGPLFAGLSLFLFSYLSSWGMLFHTENLLWLHALVLALTPCADALSLDARGRAAPAEDARYGWPLVLLCAVTAATYVVAGVAKLELSGLAWASGEILQQQIAWDAARKLAIGSTHSALGAALAPHAWVFAPLAVLTLAIELGAPAALLSRRLARVWVAAALAFHWGVFALMWIAFPYPMSGIAFASFFLQPSPSHSSELPVQRST